MTIYVPDALAAEVREHLGDSNVSAICQAALLEKVNRAKAYAEAVAEGGFERIEVYNGNRGEDIAFQGRKVGYAEKTDQTAYLTPKGKVALYEGAERRLYVYQGYDHFASDGYPSDLIAEVARALGQRYVRELDI